MKEDFIFYARARGIKEISIILKHVLKNSLQTSINALGMSIVLLIAGTFIIENVFSIPGLGRLCITSIFNRDYPMIQGEAGRNNFCSRDAITRVISIFLLEYIPILFTI